ncbi:MAG TPA: 50S ribosomal protein L32e, partial [Methanocorpusculum sp.]|nr:50S ribosomal protein L32e [Methanocorpusculum sp.]
HPEAGYGSPVAVRGYHRSGYRECLVFNIKDLENIDEKTTAIRIGGSVGWKKRSVIQEKALNLNIKILNKKEHKISLKSAPKNVETNVDTKNTVESTTEVKSDE